MTAVGLGCVKTQAHAVHVEQPTANCTSGESNRAAHADSVFMLENFVLCIFPVRAFSLSQGHSRRR
jgi:hypothetical protein